MRRSFELVTRNILMCIAVVVMAAPISTAGYAANDCSSYGATAVSQHNQNKSNNCGFSGLRWHSDRGGHEAFCNLVGSGKAAKETQIRQRDLDGCIASGNQQEEVQEARQCKKSEIAKGQGTSNQRAESAARDELADQKAQMIHDGYSKCLYYKLGCSGPNGDKTCRMSIRCCTQ